MMTGADDGQPIGAPLEMRIRVGDFESGLTAPAERLRRAEHCSVALGELKL
jgi:hypothetical protein